MEVEHAHNIRLACQDALRQTDHLCSEIISHAKNTLVGQAASPLSKDTLRKQKFVTMVHEAREMQRRGEHEKALNKYTRALKITKNLDAKYVMQVKKYLGDVNRAIGESNTALSFYRDVKELAIQLHAPQLVEEILFCMASIHQENRNLNEALSAHQERLDFAGNRGNMSGLAQAYLGCADIYFHQGRYKLAVSDYSEHISIIQQSDTLAGRAEQADAQNKLGGALYRLGNYAGAIDSYQKSLEVQPNPQYIYGRTCSLLGDAFLATGDVKAAIECFQQHLTIAQAVSNRLELGVAHAGLGQCFLYRANHYLKGETENHEGNGSLAITAANQAIGHFRRHLSAATDEANMGEQRKAYNNLGGAEMILENYEQAVKYFTSQINITNEDDRELLFEGHVKLGSCLKALGHIDGASTQLTKAMSVALTMDHRANVALAHLNLGHFHLHIQEYDDALWHFQAHIEVARELEDIQSEIEATCFVAITLMSMGAPPLLPEDIPNRVPGLREDPSEEQFSKLDLASKWFQRHQLLAREHNDWIAITRSLAGLGECCRFLRRFQEAIKYHSACSKVQLELGDEMGHCGTLELMGYAYLAMHDHDKAQQCFNNFVSTSRKIGDFQGEERATELSGYCLEHKYNTTERLQ